MLTERQKLVLHMLLDSQDGGRHAPSQQEIADQMGIVKSQVHYTLKQLEERGFVELRPNKPRSVVVTRYPDGTATEIGTASTAYIRELEAKVKELEGQVSEIWSAKIRTEKELRDLRLKYGW
jgi:DNA-binding MarR family transcriptional regulator